MKVLKISGVATLVVLVLLVLSKPHFQNYEYGNTVTSDYAESFPANGYGGYEIATGADIAGAPSFVGVVEEAAPSLMSAKRVGYSPTPPMATGGADAEEYEVSEYTASIETSEPEDACDVVKSLKAEATIVFLSSSETDSSCYFTFKAEKNAVGKVLTLLYDLDPEELTEHTYTIEKQIEYFITEEDVLKQKLEAIDTTLSSAQKAYAEITDVAAESKDANALARVIESRLAIIERLTQEKISVGARLQEIARAKAEQMENLDYTRFSVSITERRIIDGDALGESWKIALQSFFYSMSSAIQVLVLGVAVELVYLLRYAFYLFLLFFAVKYGVRWGKTLWNQ